jgi:hypothetical protein
MPAAYNPGLPAGARFRERNGELLAQNRSDMLAIR